MAETREKQKLSKTSYFVCFVISGFTLIVWQSLYLHHSLVGVEIDNPAGLGIFVIAPFVVAIPFALFSSLLIRRFVTKFISSNPLLLGVAEFTVFLLLLLIATYWSQSIASVENKYEVELWLGLFILFMPPLFLAQFLTSFYSLFRISIPGYLESIHKK